MQTLALPGLPDPAVVVRHARAARRLRLQVAGLRGQERLARRIEAALCAEACGAESARADPRTGRVLVRYAPGAPLLDGLRRTEDTGRGRRSPGRHRQRFPSLAWHALEEEQVLARLETGRKGLTDEEARRRRREGGTNAVDGPGERSRLEILRDQVANLPSALLIGSAGLSVLVRELLDAGAIAAAVGLDAGIGYAIERTNEDLLAAWQRLEAGEARVLREGRIRKIPARELMPGDVLIVRAGDTVAADARIIDAHRLSCNESILTGESEPRAKRTGAVAAEAALAERGSMLYAATSVASGRGRAVVTAIGPHTEAARIRALLEAERAPETPFEQRMERLGASLALAGAGAGVLSAGLGLLRLRPLGEVLGNAVALGVAAIPEGLPVVSTAALVRSMQRMRESGMVVRRLVSAETLGGVSVVCADKTGTLTRNEMRVEALDLGRGRIDPASVTAESEKLFEDPGTLVLAASILNSDVDVQVSQGVFSVSGSPTERALLETASAAGLDRAELIASYPRRLLRERNADAHYVTSLHEAPGGRAVAFVKGAPEQVVRLCDRAFGRALDGAGREEVLDRNAAIARDGLRVLAVGWKRLPEPDPDAMGAGFELIGLIGLRDPLRPGAAATVQAAARSGIRTVMLTGDQRRTAEAVAREVGLEGEILDGSAVTRLLADDGPAARARLRRVAAFSRVTPADKVAIVHAMRGLGHVVAMAGDGINDAPALKAADVGIAIGRHSSDLSREAADIVLASEDLGSILHAVGEGRVVQDNLRRAVRYLLSTNLAEVWLALGASVLAPSQPLTTLRLLWLNLLSDTLPALALALEPAQGDVLARPPAPPDAPIVAPEERRAVVRDSLLLTGLGAVSLAVGGPATAFSTFAGADIGYSLSCRVPNTPPDARFLGLLGATAGLHLAGIAFPPMRSLLRLPPALSLAEVAGFGTGMILPWAVTRARHDLVVVRRGTSPDEETP